MLDSLVPTAAQRLEIGPRRIEVPFGEGDGALVRLSLPPVEEILAIRELPAQQLSLSQVADDAEGYFRELFADEAARLEQKADRFKASATYLCRLASVKELAGDLSGAQDNLERATKIDTGGFAYLKLGTNLFRQNRLAEAKSVFGAECLRKDVEAQLRLALLAIVEGHVEQAREYANNALVVDSLDYRAQLVAGVIDLAGREFERAIRHFRVAAEENPTSAVVLVDLAVAQICTGHPTKAIRALKTAVRLNPLNANAIALLADLGFAQSVAEETVPSLETFLKYEQKIPSMWARLARAYFTVKEYDKALKALRQEASLRDSASVWNNIGVCMWERGELAKAAQTLRYAITRPDVNGETGRENALVNVVALLAREGKGEEVLKISEEAINREGIRKFASSERLHTLCTHNLIALSHRGQFEEFERRAEFLLQQEFIVPRLRETVLASVIYHFTAIAPNKERAKLHAEQVWTLAVENAIGVSHDRYMAVNNAAFAYIGFGDLRKAEALLQRLSGLVHVLPYPTATLGYLHFAKGHAERGEKLYEEAIRLLADGRARRLFMQKLNLEKARYLVRSGKVQEGRKYVRLVLQIEDGVPAFLEDAQQLLARLPG